MTDNKPQNRFKRTNNLPTTKRKCFHPPVHSIPSVIAVPSMGNAYTRRHTLGYYKEPMSIPYGDNHRVELSGMELNVGDEILLIIVASLARRYYSDRFEISWHELYRSYGKRSSPGLKNTLKKRFNRVLHTRHQNVFTQKGWEMSFSMGIIADLVITRNKIGIVIDPAFYEVIKQGWMTSIDLPLLISLKGDIAPKIYIDSQRHTSASKKDKYELPSVGLEKYCDRSGLDRDHKRPATKDWLRKKRQQIKVAILQLMEKGYPIDCNVEDLEKNLVSITVKSRKVPELEKWVWREARKPVEKIKELPWKGEHKEEPKQEEAERPRRERSVDKPEPEQPRRERKFEKGEVAIGSHFHRGDDWIQENSLSAEELIDERTYLAEMELERAELEIEKVYREAVNKLDFDEEKTWIKS